MAHVLDFSGLGVSEKVEEKIQIPQPTGDIKKVMIKEKLKNLGFEMSDFALGAFDHIGEAAARKSRDPSSELYKTKGCFFRPNYERGILIYALIKKYKIKSFLEIGFGRGYGTLCAAMAMRENGAGRIVTVDPNFNEDHINYLGQIFPEEWFQMIQFMGGTSDDYFTKFDEKFDMIYLDGDHTYQAVLNDWNHSKDRYNKVLLFDDYHLPTKRDANIECASVIDQIEDDSKELIIMDRRIFLDDRGYTDDQIDYGQVLLTR